MVNRNNVIAGQKIDRHPLADSGLPMGVFIKGSTVIAVQAEQGGVVQTPEGEMTFHAGDYILTDNPPTHAWPVRQLVFETTYEKYETITESPVGPEPKATHVPDLSIPPADAAQIVMASKAADGRLVEVPAPQTGEVALDDSIEVSTDTPQATQQPPVPADALPGAQDTSPDSTTPPKKRSGKGIATSKTLPGLPTGPEE